MSAVARADLAALADPALPRLPAALDPAAAAPILRERLRAWRPGAERWALRGARLLRYKPGRRCLIEYGFETPDGAQVALLGKLRAKGADHRTFALMQALRAAGLTDAASDGVAVPEPVALVPELGLWLQRRVAGVPATELLRGPTGPWLAPRVAAALHRLHALDAAALGVERVHTAADELAALARWLPLAAARRPTRAARIHRLLAACTALGPRLAGALAAAIHRDFYPDQLLVGERRLYLLDLDLCCRGDPALDAGNFVAHLMELALRETGDPDAYRGAADAFLAAFLARHPAARARCDAYVTLTLARHVYLSTELPGRAGVTGALLALCEARLGLRPPPRRRRPAAGHALPKGALP